MSNRVAVLANEVLQHKRITVSDAMVKVLGQYSDRNANLHQAVFEEIDRKTAKDVQRVV